MYVYVCMFMCVYNMFLHVCINLFPPHGKKSLCDTKKLMYIHMYVCIHIPIYVCVTCFFLMENVFHMHTRTGTRTCALALSYICPSVFTIVVSMAPYGTQTKEITVL